MPIIIFEYWRSYVSLEAAVGRKIVHYQSLMKNQMPNAVIRNIYIYLNIQIVNLYTYFYFRLPKPVTAKPLSQIDEDGVREKDLERVPGISK